MNTPLLSFIIPSLNLPLEVFQLVKKLSTVPNSEIILINQSPHKHVISQTIAGVKEILLENRVCASEARNMGADNSKGEFLFFLDDDADINALETLHDEYFVRHLMQNDIVIVDRCFKKNGEIISHNPPAVSWRTRHWNMIKFVTEWNICIRKKLFMSAGKFPKIGTGSSSKAQSGEVFVLFAKLFTLTIRISYMPEVKVVHPAYTTGKPFAKCLGYSYGAGYSVALSLRYFSSMMRPVWIVRVFIAAMRDFFSAKKSLLVPSDAPFDLHYRWRFAVSRIHGLFDGIIIQFLNKEYINE